MRALVCVAVAASLAVGIAAPAQDAKKDGERLQGRWTAVGAFDADGKVQKVVEGDPEYAVFEFGADKVAIRVKKHAFEGTYKLDPSKTPKEVDALIRHGDQDVTVQGIYAVEKGRLKICFSGPGGARPKEFKAGNGAAVAVEMLRAEQ